MPWLDGTFTQQNFILPLRDAASYYFWVFVMDGVTASTYMTVSIIAVGNDEADFFTAIRTKIHSYYRCAHTRELCENVWNQDAFQFFDGVFE